MLGGSPKKFLEAHFGPLRFVSQLYFFRLCHENDDRRGPITPARLLQFIMSIRSVYRHPDVIAFHPADSHLHKVIVFIEMDFPTEPPYYRLFPNLSWPFTSRGAAKSAGRLSVFIKPAVLSSSRFFRMATFMDIEMLDCTPEDSSDPRERRVIAPRGSLSPGFWFSRYPVTNGTDGPEHEPGGRTDAP